VIFWEVVCNFLAVLTWTVGTRYCPRLSWLYSITVLGCPDFTALLSSVVQTLQHCQQIVSHSHMSFSIYELSHQTSYCHRTSKLQRPVHPRIWLKPIVATCFAIDRPKALTHRVLVFVNCLWCLFWNRSFDYQCSFFLSICWLCGVGVPSGCGHSRYAYFTFLKCKTDFRQY
jgi:hypothetical protein